MQRLGHSHQQDQPVPNYTESPEPPPWPLAPLDPPAESDRLVRGLCYTDGTWLKEPRGVPVHNATNYLRHCASPELFSAVRDYRWAPRCPLRPWDRDAFCRLLSGGLVLYGDSLMADWAVGLWVLLGPEQGHLPHLQRKAKRLTTRIAEITHLPICGRKASIFHLRAFVLPYGVNGRKQNQQLAPLDLYLSEHPGAILLVGSGPHYTDGRQGGISEVPLAWRGLSERHARHTLFYVTYPPGHPHCETSGAPLGHMPPLDPATYVGWYGWWDLEVLRDWMLGNFTAGRFRPGHFLLDTVPILRLRPDTRVHSYHSDLRGLDDNHGGDCLHFCTGPGVWDSVSLILYNLLAQLSEVKGA